MKSWWKSKTIWVGVLQVISSVALSLSSFLSEGGTLDVDSNQTILALNGIAMIVLRWLTDKPIDSPVAVMDSMRPRIKKNQACKRYIVK